jgi:putative Holliday junction resolvase
MRLASIDVGLKRIGFALCLKEGIITPQEAILRKNRNQAAKEVKEALEAWRVEKLIVGIPLDANNSEEMKRRIEHFVSLLDLPIPVVYQDEQNSSHEAKERTQGVFRHKRDGKIDSIAAQIILERYLNTL